MSGGSTLSTVGDLIRDGCWMKAWCPACGRRDVDLEALARRYGRDATYIKPQSPIRIRCARCGAKPLDYVIGGK